MKAKKKMKILGEETNALFWVSKTEEKLGTVFSNEGWNKINSKDPNSALIPWRKLREQNCGNNFILLPSQKTTLALYKKILAIEKETNY